MNKGAGGSRLGRIMRLPIRALSRARDFYVNSLTNCAGRMPQSAVGMGYMAELPHSYSLRSDSSETAGDADLRELIRAASQGRMRALDNSNNLRPVVPRSQSVAVGRIDEDQPCDNFQDEVRVGTSLLFPRSRSCAVPKRRVAVLA